MAKEKTHTQEVAVNSVQTTTPNAAQLSEKEKAQATIAALLAQFGNTIVPVDVATARIETAHAENAAEIKSVTAEIDRIKSAIAPLNEALKPLFVRLAQLTGKKSKVSGEKNTRATCLECGQGRHSQWKNKEKGELNALTANCKTYAARKAAEAASN